jgi:hypothetical protein
MTAINNWVFVLALVVYSVALTIAVAAVVGRSVSRHMVDTVTNVLTDVGERAAIVQFPEFCDGVLTAVVMVRAGLVKRLRLRPPIDPAEQVVLDRFVYRCATIRVVGGVRVYDDHSASTKGRSIS